MTCNQTGFELWAYGISTLTEEIHREHSSKILRKSLNLVTRETRQDGNLRTWQKSTAKGEISGVVHDLRGRQTMDNVQNR